MARRAFAVSDAVRERVRYLAGLGVRQDDIAKIIGCAPKTLRKRFRDELDRGVAEANATISGYLFAAERERIGAKERRRMNRFRARLATRMPRWLWFYPITAAIPN
jgi:hypothetical protein